MVKKMANFRAIHTQIWKDEWFVDLTINQKVLFIYLFSNEASSFTGLYKITKQACQERKVERINSGW